MGNSVTTIAFFAVLSTVAHAENDIPALMAGAAISNREWFLAAVIATMVACGLVSYALRGRISVRTHISLAMLVVLIGGFALFLLFQAVLSGVLVVVGYLTMIGLFKLMSRFEARESTKENRSIGRGKP